ncbi:hypothetical protein [Alkalimarinus sediminis]|uniref:Glutamate--cysteine ligase n=1 Tax=Alkalimarinus sediminis TaxID=1632866 RepID=A0A9E8HNZ4_9ALTE|nr:hypothetical protein [Alkalimarinus sediminis]UZW73796.1 hypothetical protein NNL22_12195 [Alkalimarinus sediminis]
MGRWIDRSDFSPKEFARFNERLADNLSAFRTLLDRQNFGMGERSYGAELELYITDKLGQPLALNRTLLDDLQDPHLTLELNQFNLEYNLDPILDSNKPFSELSETMKKALSEISSAAQAYDARVLPIGILPTLQKQHVGMDAITDIPRYHALARALRDRRGSDFHIHISGQDELDLSWQDVTLEGANTSFQYHYRVNPDEFASSFNVAQLVTPLVLALGANSPLFFGQRLWHETRIALFKQSVDCRMDEPLSKRLPARVFFGHGWVRQDIYELFAENVYLFEPLMPICSSENNHQLALAGEVPPLDELRLHQGSVWSWNRPIYDPVGDGHLRIEVRSLPAGPSVDNMIANAALMTGLIEGLKPHIDKILPGIPFRYAEHNFYRAAKHGLDAKLLWPEPAEGALKELPVVDILDSMIVIAEEGLQRINIAESEISYYLGIIRDGLAARMNGARWQLNMYEKLSWQCDQTQTLVELVDRYYRNTMSHKPVHEWSEQL